MKGEWVKEEGQGRRIKAMPWRVEWSNIVIGEEMDCAERTGREQQCLPVIIGKGNIRVTFINMYTPIFGYLSPLACVPDVWHGRVFGCNFGI
jgi:hypothetical protein